MTTLIQTGQPGSPLYRRCDARCQYAKGPVCDCVCHGRYHGCGIDGSLIQKIHETEDDFLDYLESLGCDVDALVAAKKGALAEELETERKAWLARKRPTGGHALRPRKRRGRFVDPRQRVLNFEASEAILEHAENELYDYAGREISGRQSTSPAEAGRDPTGTQDGPEKGGD